MDLPRPPASDLSPLSPLAPELASTFVKVGGDIALVIGDDGVIRNVAEGQGPVSAGTQGWVGRAWVDTATADTRRKIELLLQEAGATGLSRRREVNHPGPSGSADSATVPVSWAAVRLGTGGPVLAVGRDLRAVTAIQQRFLEAQQELEQDYWQRRRAEARYRQLFQVARDAVLVVDADTLAVLEANPAAGELFGGASALVSGALLRDHVDSASAAVVDELMCAARTTGHASELRVRLASGGVPVDLSATPFRSDERQCLLVRARASAPSADFFEQMPDAAVITDSTGRVRMANAAFLKLCGIGDESRLRGWPLGDALGDLHGQWAGLLAQVRAQGLIGRATVRLNLAGPAAGVRPMRVEISGALLAEGDQEDIGFTLRPLADGPALSRSNDLADALGALVHHLGSEPLAELVQRAAQLTEQHLIEAALARFDGDVEQAAGLLSMSVADLRTRMNQLGIVPRLLLN